MSVLVALGSLCLVQATTIPVAIYRDLGGNFLSATTAVAADSQGYLWVATQHGLVRYDGRTAKVYDLSDGLPDLHVYDVVCDKSGTVWVGTWRGLARSAGERFECACESVVGGRGPVRRLALGMHGEIWAGADGGELLRVDDRGCTSVTTPAYPVVTHLAVDLRGRPWVANMWRDQAVGPSVVDGQRVVPASDLGCPPGVVRLGEGPHGVWLVTEDGRTWKEEDGGFAPLHIPSWRPSLVPLAWVARGDVEWFVSDSLAVALRAGEVYVVETVQVLPGRMAVDEGGNLWFPRRDGALGRSGSWALRRVPLPRPTASGVVRAGDDGSLWCGVEWGVLRLPPSGDAAWEMLPLPDVMNVAPLPGGSALVGTRTGLLWVGQSPLRVVRRWGKAEGLPSDLVTLLGVQGESCWVGTFAGAAMLSLKEGTVRVPRGMPPLLPTVLHPQGARVLVGTWAGLFSIQGDSVVSVRSPHTPFQPAITAVDHLPDGTVLVGTYSDGLFALEGDSLTRLPVSLSRVRSLLRDPRGEHYVVGPNAVYAVRGHHFVEMRQFPSTVFLIGAVATEDGLWCATPAALERVGEHWAYLDSHLGLDGRILYVGSHGRDQVVVLTERELYFVRTGDLAQPLVRREPWVEVLRAAGTTAVTRGQVLRLPRRERDLSLRLRYPSVASGTLQVSWLLRPADQVWSPWDWEGQARYVSLPPGTYTLWVQVRTATGSFLDPEPVARLVIPPLWHERWEGRVLLAMALVVAGLAAGLSRMSAARRRSAHLERLVAQRTRDLEAARAKAVERSREKGKLLARMAHELRTPLTAVVGFASMTAEDDRVPDEHRAYAQTIVQASEKLLGLIRSILALGRAEASLADLARVPLDVSAVAADVVKLLQLKAEERGVRLEHQGCATPGEVLGDADRLREVLINLVGNALRYTPAGGRITVRVWESDDHVNIAVEDTGTGIPETLLPRVFEAFVRGEGGEEGAGLGLTISKQLVEAMDGEIGVQSREGEGTTFTVRLPRAQKGASGQEAAD